MLWHSLDALALWAFRACDWETRADAISAKNLCKLLSILFYSYVSLSILLSSPHWQICASKIINIQRSARILSKILWVSRKDVKQVYQYRDIQWCTVIYRDMPWCKTSQDGLAYQIWPPDRLGARVQKPKQEVWSNICGIFAGHLQGGIEQTMIR